MTTIMQEGCRGVAGVFLGSRDILTREEVRPYLTNVTVAPITSTIKGLSTEVPVGANNGLDHDAVISCDNIQTIPRDRLGKHIGLLFEHQEKLLTVAICHAFDLD